MTLLHDLRHAARLMGRSPGFVLTALATLSLAIGVNTAVFSVVYGVLLRPLPYADADRLVRLSEVHPRGTPIVRNAVLSSLTFDAWRTSARTIEGVSAYSNQVFTVTGLDEPVRLVGASVSPSLFPTLGVPPYRGRFFVEQEATRGASGVVILSYGLWQRRFAGDNAAIGRTMRLDGQAFEIVGVTPAWFYFPDRESQLWTPFIPPRVEAESIRVLSALARLKPGATIDQVVAEGTAAARGTKRPFAAELIFGKGGPVEVHVRRVVDEMTSRVRPAMLVMMTAVGLVLLIACANVANLLLARGVSRGRELAVRAALGAGRGRLTRQLLTESLAIAVLGGALGVLVAWALTRALPVWAPEGFPRLEDVRLDLRVLSFAVLLSVVAGALAGLVPALRGSRSDLLPALRADDTRSVGSGSRMRAVLLASEAAMSVMLLIGAALLIRSFVTLIHVNPGYDASSVLTARVYLTGAASKPDRVPQIVDALVERLQTSPGVAAAGAGSMAPLNQSTAVSGFSFRASPAAEPVTARGLYYVVTPGYAEALRLRLIEGRLLQPSDIISPIQALVVNEAFAKAYINDGKPVAGRRYQGLLSGPKLTTEIVGVVGNVLKDGLDRQPQGELYVAHSQARQITREINLVIRTERDPSAFSETLRSIVRDVEPTAALDDVATLASRVSESVGHPRFASAVVGVFAVLALVLAATGLYSVLSYSVSQRRREIGIRSALGATRVNLIVLVVRQGLTVTLVGLVLGVIASAVATRLMQPLLFGVRPLDLPSFVWMPLLLLVVALVACAVPARRAAATDPAHTLRSE